APGSGGSGPRTSGSAPGAAIGRAVRRAGARDAGALPGDPLSPLPGGPGVRRDRGDAGDPAGDREGEAPSGARDTPTQAERASARNDAMKENLSCETCQSELLALI